MNLVFQGTIDHTDETQIECMYDNMIISLIVINNVTSDYNITVSRLETAAVNLKTLLYEFQLDNGDSIRDSTQYIMSKGDYISLESSQPDTTYYVSTEIL